MSEPHLGWFHVEEEAARLIARSFDKPCDARNAMACYVMLCRKANLKGSDTFEDTIGSMARDLNCVYRDTQKALGLVEAIKLVKIERRKLPGTTGNAPSVYTVTRIRPDIMSAPTDNTSEPSRRDRVRDESRTFPKNSPQEQAKELHQERGATRRTRFVPPTVSEAEAEAEGIGMPGSEGQAFIDYHQAKGWVIGKSPMKDWRAAMRTWKRTYIRIQSGSNSKPKRSRPEYRSAI